MVSLPCHAIKVSNFNLSSPLSSNPSVMGFIGDPPRWLDLGLENGNVSRGFVVQYHIHPATTYVPLGICSSSLELGFTLIIVISIVQCNIP